MRDRPSTLNNTDPPIFHGKIHGFKPTISPSSNLTWYGTPSFSGWFIQSIPIMLFQPCSKPTLALPLLRGNTRGDQSSAVEGHPKNSPPTAWHSSHQPPQWGVILRKTFPLGKNFLEMMFPSKLSSHFFEFWDGKTMETIGQHNGNHTDSGNTYLGTVICSGTWSKLLSSSHSRNTVPRCSKDVPSARGSIHIYTLLPVLTVLIPIYTGQLRSTGCPSSCWSISRLHVKYKLS